MLELCFFRWGLFFRLLANLLFSRAGIFSCLGYFFNLLKSLFSTSSIVVLFWPLTVTLSYCYQACTQAVLFISTNSGIFDWVEPFVPYKTHLSSTPFSATNYYYALINYSKLLDALNDIKVPSLFVTKLTLVCTSTSSMTTSPLLSRLSAPIIFTKYSKHTLSVSTTIINCSLSIAVFLAISPSMQVAQIISFISN